MSGEVCPNRTIVAGRSGEGWDAKHAQRALVERQYKRALREASKTATDEVKVEVNRLATELNEIPVPPPPWLTVDDVTPEGLASLLSKDDGALAVLSPEGGVFEILARRYSNGVPKIDVFLKGHAGDNLRIDRIARGSELIEHPAFAVGLAVQPDVIRGLSTKPGFRGRSHIERFLFSMPRSHVGHRWFDAPAVPSKVRDAYARHVEAPAARPMPAKPPTLRLSRPRPLRCT